MRKLFFLLLILPCFAIQLPTARGAGASKHIASYRIDAQLKLDERGRPSIVDGKSRLVWLNDSTDSIGDLQFHLYLNAFKNEKSSFFRESGGQLRDDKFAPGEWGSIEVKEMMLAGNEDLLKTAEFIHPDDNNADDQTVLRVKPSRPVKPGQTITIDMVFYSRLPRVYARTGYWGSFAMVAQWFPKIGVWEAKGERRREQAGWNCHQFHADTEFYADFGVYDVNLTVPATYRGKVDATGDLRSERINADGTVTYNFYQEDVHDFAWTADTSFIKVIRTFKPAEHLSQTEIDECARRLNLPSSQVTLRDVEVILLLQAEHANQADRHFRAAFNALKYFGLWYGAYPYPTLAIVDPPYKANGAGGMEYPTLVTAGTRWRPGRDQNPEEVIVHEIAHQYWYGLVASNEFEESWMDEGMTTYVTAKVLGTAYGANVEPFTLWGVDLFYLPFSTPHPLEDRLLTLKSSFTDPIVTPGWKYLDSTSYAINSYPRTGLVLNTLERYLGEPVMARVMRTYFEKWRYSHPTSADFFDTVNEVSGKDMSWFFDQFVQGTSTLDYEVSDATSNESRVPGGEGKQDYTTEIAVIRRTEAWFPVELLVNLEDGSHISINPGQIVDGAINYRIQNSADGALSTDRWPIGTKWKKFRLITKSPVVSAVLDPQRKVLLDANWTNNGYTTSTGLAGGFRWGSGSLFWVQAVFQALSFLS